MFSGLIELELWTDLYILEDRWCVVAIGTLCVVADGTLCEVANRTIAGGKESISIHVKYN